MVRSVLLEKLDIVILDETQGCVSRAMATGAHLAWHLAEDFAPDLRLWSLDLVVAPAPGQAAATLSAD